MRDKDDYLPGYTDRFSLDPARTALLLIDLQYATACRNSGLGRKMADEGKAETVDWRYTQIEKRVVPNVRRFLDHGRARKIRTFYFQLGSRYPDFRDILPRMLPFVKAVNNHAGERVYEILDEIKPDDEIVLHKTTASAFASTPIDGLLRLNGISQLVLMGVATNNCVDTTGRWAADLGYQCVIVEDACSAATEALHNSALIAFGRQFGRVDSTDEVLAELGA